MQILDSSYQVEKSVYEGESLDLYLSSGIRFDKPFLRIGSILKIIFERGVMEKEIDNTKERKERETTEACGVMEKEIHNTEAKEEKETTEASEATEPQYFQCSICSLKEKYEYFGKSPEFVYSYKLKEDSYIIEDPFLPPRNREYLVLGSHCIKCTRPVCKDSNCSFYFDATYCIRCAKGTEEKFPKPLREKLNRIIIN
ncbi:hypothetical protein FQA39_LY08249 [Lamprigera yunnana]|nr:hypothetical protein FQA39_LY08249 [Lamprigera yunnana]